MEVFEHFLLDSSPGKLNLYESGVPECPFSTLRLRQNHNIAAAMALRHSDRTNHATCTMSFGFRSARASSMPSLNVTLDGILSMARKDLASNS
jgi:hypothetical protein